MRLSKRTRNATLTRWIVAALLVSVGELAHAQVDAGRNGLTVTIPNLTQKTDTSKAEPARTTRYAWDALNRLAEVSDGAGVLIARYTYDPFDRRIKKELGGSATLQTAGPGGSNIANTTTHFLQSEWGTLAEANAAGQVQVVYGWTPQRDAGVAPLFAKLRDPAQPTAWRTVYYHNDHLGTPQRVTDQAGAVVWSADYDAFGKAVTKTTADPTTAIVSNLRLPGQYWDAETGLHYNDRRFYDPDTGRYTARDPIGFEGGINLYAYAAGAPGRLTDPTGEIPACLLLNYGRCMLACGLQGVGMSALQTMLDGGCGDLNLLGIAKDCAIDCLWAMLPIPDPCGKLGKLFGAAMGVAAGLMNSFPGETLVHARDAGGKAVLKPIALIEVGDEVLAWDEMAAVDGVLKQSSKGSAVEARATRYEKVSAIATSEKQQRLVHLTLDSGEKLTATDGHPFRTSEGWRDAILLKKGGKLLLKGSGDGDDDSAGLAAITSVEIEIRTVRVFNLEVANLHTFFVGREGALVHNVHGNSRTSPLTQVVYEIFNIATKATIKYGVANCNSKKSRPERQLKPGQDYRYTDNIPGGPNARGRAYDRERDRVTDHYNQNGQKPPGNDLPNPW